MKTISKAAAIATSVALFLPLAAFADTLTGNSTVSDVTVTNTNRAMVFNMTSARSSTGDNYAGGSYGGSGGSGGEVEASGGGSGSAVITDSSGGTGGTGGTASDGGAIQTGDAAATAGTMNSVNSNITDIQGCGCNATSTGGNDVLTDNAATSSVAVNNNNDGMLGNGTMATADTGGSKASGSRGGRGGSAGDVEARVQGGSGVVTNGTGGDGGAGGNSGLGGTILTGSSTTNSGTVNVINWNLTRVRP